jgi:hypothetical protein
VEVATRHPEVSIHLGYAVLTCHMTDVNPYRMIGTASSKHRLEATGPKFISPGTRILTFLPWRRCVVAKSKLQKVNPVSLPHVKTTIILIWASKCVLTGPREARGTLTRSHAAPSVRSGRSQPGTGSDPAWGRNPTPDRGLSPTQCGRGSDHRQKVRAGLGRPPALAPNHLSSAPTCQGKHAQCNGHGPVSGARSSSRR